jgi:hypothetical protein
MAIRVVGADLCVRPFGRPALGEKIHALTLLPGLDGVAANREWSILIDFV